MNETKKNKFDWGETVKVKKSAPSHLNPGQIGSVCGMVQIFSDGGIKKYSCQKGDWVYTIEYIGGLDKTVAECYLEIYPDCLKYILGEKALMKSSLLEDYHPSEVVFISNCHQIFKKSLAKKFNLKIGDFVYVMKPKNGEEFLAPESFVERKVDS